MRQIKNIFQKGQIGLIVVLIVAVGLTIGLAIVSQSVTDISVSETEEKSLRAFNAAEAGIEEILRRESLVGGISEDIEVTDDLTAAVTVEERRTQSVVLGRNEAIEVPLLGATTSRLKISWVDTNDSEQNPGTCTESEAPASLEIIRIRNESGQIVPYRYLYNACDALDSINNFSNILGDSPGLQDGEEPYLKQIIFTNIDGDDSDGIYDSVMRIRTFYNKASVAIVDPDGEGLPVQEYQIVSSTSIESGETRSVEVTRSIEAWPPIFDYVLFSGSQPLVKN